MKTVISKIIIGTVLAAAVFAIISIGSCEFTRRRYENGFAKIEIGNSKRNVVEFFGKPKEIENCGKRQECKEVYVYYSFMERWGFVFDSEDRVTHKYYNVSP